MGGAAFPIHLWGVAWVVLLSSSLFWVVLLLCPPPSGGAAVPPPPCGWRCFPSLGSAAVSSVFRSALLPTTPPFGWCVSPASWVVLLFFFGEAAPPPKGGEERQRHQQIQHCQHAQIVKFRMAKFQNDFLHVDVLNSHFVAVFDFAHFRNFVLENAKKKIPNTQRQVRKSQNPLIIITHTKDHKISKVSQIKNLQKLKILTHTKPKKNSNNKKHQTSNLVFCPVPLST